MTEGTEAMYDEDQETRAYLPRARAEEVQRAVQAHIDGAYGPGWEVALYPPGHEGEFWALSLEGCEEWAYGIGDAGIIPEGVFAEPVYSWCLGLYPA